jgi:C4-dicarboxylate-specific signal transduction histidine kinase
MAAVTAALLSVLVFLYAKTQSFGESDYFENVALLRHLKQLDAQWELAVLKSKIGINTHYDPLADSLIELSQLLEKLKTDMGIQKHDEAAALAEDRAALFRVVQEKAVLIEQFKSNNSVLRNSLVFLPTAAADVEQSIGKTSGNAQPAARSTLISVNKLLLASMLYSQSASDDRGAEIQAELSQLEAASQVLPSDVRERLDIFGAHVRTILREQKVVNQLLGRITVVPAATHIDEINNTLSGEQQRATVQSEQYREYLLIFSAVLVALLLYAAVRLVRSHAVINRVNKELHSANENLEQRVQERTHELRQAQSELLATAHQAGMAEIATNVLHDVGNILNSVNVSCSMIVDKVCKSRIGSVAKTASLLREHADDLAAFFTRDPTGQKLPDFLGKLAGRLSEEQAEMLQELRLLSQNIEHIKDIVAMQQNYANVSGITETVSVIDLVEDSLRMNADALTRHEVQPIREYSEVPPIKTEKHKVLQILVNLIRNAKYACDESGRADKQMTMRVTNGHDCVRVAVIDNGVGIPPENLIRIFSHGFTTRVDGHGFGLHSAVLAAQDMGGSLTAHSEGAGAGATFVLELPCHKENSRE